MTRYAVLLVVISGSAAVSTAQTETEPRSQHLPEVHFYDGVSHRDNAVSARPHFALAASQLDSRGSSHTSWPANALNRGRAHFLAGNLPQAIRAFRDGLAVAPWDAELQDGLNHCRTLVAYSVEATPAERVCPDSLTTVRDRVSPADLFAVAGISSLLAMIGLAARFTTRPTWAGPVAALGVVGILAVATVSMKLELDAEVERARPVLVVASDTILRTGNGTAFEARLPSPLPRGAEVRELHRRGGWVQIELPGGAIGWLPESAVI